MSPRQSKGRGGEGRRRDAQGRAQRSPKTQAPRRRSVAPGRKHLAPSHDGMLVALLQRTTSMPVAQAEDRQPVLAARSGGAGRYLQPAVGKTNVNIFAMARDEPEELLRKPFVELLPERGEALAGTLAAALREQTPLTVEVLLAAGADRGRFELRAYPQRHPLGLSILVEQPKDRH